MITQKAYLYNICIEFSNKSDEVIIWGNDIEHFFATLGALMADHISLISLVINSGRSHQSMTSRLTVSRTRIIHME